METDRNIRPATRDDAAGLAGIISAAFRTPAERFGLTPANAPRHPSNCRPEWVTADLDRGASYWILSENGRDIGCAGLERAQPGVAYLERVAIIPAARNRGRGGVLTRFVLEQARSGGIRRVEIGIIAAQDDLRRWYEKFGFVFNGTKSFPHLPFEVAFLYLDL
ncbi:MAG: GNAT family N-acetyltransferase [Pseudomonadota bacterium]